MGKGEEEEEGKVEGGESDEEEKGRGDEEEEGNVEGVQEEGEVE